MFNSQGREDRRRSGDEKFTDHGVFSRCNMFVRYSESALVLREASLSLVIKAKDYESRSEATRASARECFQTPSLRSF